MAVKHSGNFDDGFVGSSAILRGRLINNPFVLSRVRQQSVKSEVVVGAEMRELRTYGLVRKILAEVWCPKVVGTKTTYRADVDIIL